MGVSPQRLKAFLFLRRYLITASGLPRGIGTDVEEALRCYARNVLSRATVADVALLEAELVPPWPTEVVVRAALRDGSAFLSQSEP